MTPLVSIPFDSPHYPLPADYLDLTEEGQRQARVNATRQWRVQGTPDENGYRRAASVEFFDYNYLWPDEEASFDPGFYDDKPLPTPDMHRAILSLYGSGNLNLAVAPRGGAKSTLCRKDSLTLLTSCPSYSIAYCTSSNDNAKMSGTIIRDQLYENSRIHEDFTSEYGIKRFKPSRGYRPTGTEFFYTNHNSWVRCISAQSKMRGLRPRKFKLDDPEFDERASTSMQLIRDYMTRLVFKVAYAMVLREGSGIDWTATFVSKRHYAWSAMSMITGPDGQLTSEDPRFNFWNRLLIVAAIPNPDKPGTYISCWPEMWPPTVEDRIARGIRSPVSLPEIEERMGRASFKAEMQGDPGDSESSFFKCDHNVNGTHAWWLEGHDETTLLDPFSSQALICWRRMGSTVRMPIGEFLRQSRVFITVDTAYTENASSDRRCCACMAINSFNELFILDLWSDRKPDGTLFRRAMDQARTWNASAIHIEVVKESYKLYNRFLAAITTGAATAMGYTHLPAIRKIKPGPTSKTDKISTLDTRFEQQTIKIPWFRLVKGPWWGRLRDQIDGFNPEADNGGLGKDDEIDTVSMSLFVVKGKLPHKRRGLPDTTDALELIRRGKTKLPGTDIPIASGLPLSFLTTDIVDRLIENHRDPSPKETAV